VSSGLKKRNCRRTIRRTSPGARHFYVRQLHEMKIKLLAELFTPKVMLQYAEYWIFMVFPV
jgi:hypothetical protein